MVCYSWKHSWRHNRVPGRRRQKADWARAHHIAAGVQGGHCVLPIPRLQSGYVSSARTSSSPGCRVACPGLPHRQHMTPCPPPRTVPRADTPMSMEHPAAGHEQDMHHCLWKTTTHLKQICTSVWKNLWVEFGLAHSGCKMKTCKRMSSVITRTLHLYRSGSV